MRRFMIAGNWKMNKTIQEAVSLVKGLKQDIGSEKLYEKVDIVVCPPATALIEVKKNLSDKNIGLGAQNMCWEGKGAFTGEISPLMLLDTGCKYVIIGHSERRHIFGEKNADVNKKVLSALKHGLIPIMCVGETLEERNQNLTFDVVQEHVSKGLLNVSRDQMKKVIIAYEPVWAIGTGVNATPRQAQEVHKFIRGLLTQIFSEDIAGRAIILYGGSVKPDNIASLSKEEDVDGALVGGASLDRETFIGIIKNSFVHLQGGN